MSFNTSDISRSACQLYGVQAHCGYDLTNHHHALADAEACAVIGIKIW